MNKIKSNPINKKYDDFFKCVCLLVDVNHFIVVWLNVFLKAASNTIVFIQSQ